MILQRLQSSSPFEDVYYDIEYVIVGGGGAGASNGSNCAGGGGGYVERGTLSVIQFLTYSVIIGSGGIASAGQAGTNGSQSSLGDIVALPGLGGNVDTGGNSRYLGSNGGGGNNSAGTSAAYSGYSGYYGGSGGSGIELTWDVCEKYLGCGGGAAGTGSSHTFSSAYGPTHGGYSNSEFAENSGYLLWNSPGFGAEAGSAGQAGAPNTGQGGGGGNPGADGGSGLIVLRYQSDHQKGSGGTIINKDGYIYHIFTSDGVFTA